MIKILDDFFELNLFHNIQNHVKTKLYYTPRYLDDSKEKNNVNYFGSRFVLSNDPKLCDLFKEQAEKKFKIKINKIHEDSGIDLRNLDHFKPHKDISFSKINILIMLSGPKAISNGTVFYNQEDMDIHVGFRENRAVMFPSDWTHSQHASKIPNLRRYTSTLFVTDYEE